jgi:hypothetical protein
MLSRREFLVTRFGVGVTVLLGSSVTVSAAMEMVPVKRATAITQVVGLVSVSPPWRLNMTETSSAISKAR